jgi:hypothetical protein
MKDEIAVYKVPQGELVTQEPNRLIALALEQRADPETLSKLMDLQERYEAGQARKAYVLSMAAFKQEAPAVLKKNDRVDFTSTRGRTAYNYANLGSIVQEITGILGKHNLSASWETKQSDIGNVTVTCHITHSAGHRESVTLTAPTDESGNKNRIQAVGSTVTYLQRYTLLAALGLATGEDDDGRGGEAHGKPPVAMPQEKAQGHAPNSDKPATIKDPDAPVTDPQVKAIGAILSKLGINDDMARHEKVSNILALTNVIPSMRQLTKGQASEVIQALSDEANK